MPKARETRFVADAMLGSLARKLRIFGFDTSYYHLGEDAGLVKLAKTEGRIVLTADRSLAAAAEKKGVRCFLLTGSTDSGRLRQISAQAREAGAGLSKGPSRCAVCNGALARVSGEARREFPAGVEERHRLLYRCGDCGRRYWRGAHWKKLRRLAAVLQKQGQA